jgi:hypothetical protein
MTSWLRFQLRADIIGIIFFAIQIIILTSNLERKKWYLWLNLLIWSNFHSGTVSIGIVVTLLLLLPTQEEFRKNGLRLLRSLSLYLLPLVLTPLGFHIFEVVEKNLGVNINPDLQPFQWNFLLPANGGLIYSLWLLSTLWVFWMGLKIHPSNTKDFFSNYGSKGKFYLVSLLLTGLCFFRIRTVPFAMIFLLPTLTYFLFTTLEANTTKNKILRCLLVLTTLGGLLPYQWTLQKELWGNGVSSTWFPIAAVKFIKKIEPQKQLLNFFNFGAYLIHELREYPVSIDGREIPFLKFEEEMHLAMRFTPTYELFLKKYNINLIMEALPQGELINKHKLFYPQSEWAMVYADALCVIYVRRISAHSEIIAKYEKHSLIEALQSSSPSSNINPSNKEAPDRRLPSPEEIKALLEKTQREIEHR